MSEQRSTNPSAGRPAYHSIAPKGWMNDPCAPGYDPRAGKFHLFYQWTPNSHAWKDISWGHAVSMDMLRWQHTSPDVMFIPDRPYDNRGVFTGCFFPTGPDGEPDIITIFYSSIDHLPIHWTTSHVSGCEGISMATSPDGGNTWTKYHQNPILIEEPPNLDVTGFRDPYLAPWPEMAKLRNEPSDMLYAVVSGGIRGAGPRTFLYRVDPRELAHWDYLYSLTTDIPEILRPSLWSGDFGINWECTNFVNLESRPQQRTAISAGAEGCQELPLVTRYSSEHPDAPERIPRFGNWFFVDLECSQGDTREVRARPKTAGVIDWGVLYAVNTFRHPDGRTIAWGWIIEEDLSDSVLKQKTWTGCFGVPREVFLQTLTAVSGLVTKDLKQIGSVEATEEGLITLGVRPIHELQRLRGKSIVHRAQTKLALNPVEIALAPLCSEIHLAATLLNSSKRLTLSIRASPDWTSRTDIHYLPKEEKVIIDRSLSITRPDINTVSEEASFTLFNIVAGGKETLETLEIRLFIDHDVIEVFFNERCSISTRVYSPRTNTAVRLSAEGDVDVNHLDIVELDST
ncbi:hypothetical protein IAT40_005864 [Kwoniella sp. CBS 6097]